LATGFFFSLGHSTVVVALALVIALTTTALQDHFDALKDIGGMFGTPVSALFLFVIAAANILVLVQVYRTFRSVKNGGRFSEEDVDRLLSQRGLLVRIFRPAFRLIERSWHMYPLGILFGLGFDTATEVGLLGISATQASQGMSLWSILVFPALFTAGMSLIDTTDSTVMVGAYGWAFVRPIRKLYYNMMITFVSVVAALLIGGVEALGLIGDKLALQGPFWSFIDATSNNLGLLGCGIVGFFIASWIVSFLVYKVKGYDRIEASA
jgi:high-affinity nickel-transport protein